MSLILMLSLASPAEAAVVRMSQVDLIAGQTLTLRLDASATRNLTSAVVISTRSGRIAAAPAVSAILSQARDGARWLRITARADAPHEQYQVHGVIRTTFAGVVPVAVRVIAIPSPGSRISQTALWSRAEPVSRTALLEQATPYRPISRRLTTLTREATAVNVDLGSFGSSVPPPGAGGMYDPAIVSIVTTPNTQVTGHSPQHSALVGAEIVITGQELPAQVDLRLANTNLNILSASTTTIRARLPAQPLSGALVLVRQSDGEEAVLDANYQVLAAIVSVPPIFDGFESSGNGHSWKNAYLLSLLSWLAYANPTIAASQAAAWGLTLGQGGYISVVTPYFAGNFSAIGQSGSTQALVLYNAESVFVAFQGSTTDDYMQDWFDNDLDIAPQLANHWGIGVVLHHGFAEAASIAHTQLVNQVQPLVSGGRKLWLTGHSLGGAVAMLSAFRLSHENNIPVQGVQVFGAPPVGNVVWSQVFAGEISNAQRWNLERDPVPSLLPPPAFSHVGVRNNLYTNGNHQLNDPQFFFYLPSPSSLNDLMHTHMNYWCRLHEEIQQHEPAVAQQLPPPPELDSAPCGG